MFFTEFVLVKQNNKVSKIYVSFLAFFEDFLSPGSGYASSCGSRSRTSPRMRICADPDPHHFHRIVTYHGVRLPQFGVHHTTEPDPTGCCASYHGLGVRLPLVGVHHTTESDSSTPLICEYDFKVLRF